MISPKSSALVHSSSSTLVLNHGALFFVGEVAGVGVLGAHNPNPLTREVRHGYGRSVVQLLGSGRIGWNSRRACVTPLEHLDTAVEFVRRLSELLATRSARCGAGVTAGLGRGL